MLTTKWNINRKKNIDLSKLNYQIVLPTKLPYIYIEFRYTLDGPQHKSLTQTQRSFFQDYIIASNTSAKSLAASLTRLHEQ